MSPRTVLITAIAALILLGVLALWLVNVPAWGAAAAGVVAAAAAWRVGRYVAKRRDRAKTEA